MCKCMCVCMSNEWTLPVVVILGLYSFFACLHVDKHAHSLRIGTSKQVCCCVTNAQDCDMHMYVCVLITCDMVIGRVGGTCIYTCIPEILPSSLLFLFMVY